MLKIILRSGNIKLSIQLNKLTGLILLCLAFISSGLVAQENKFSLSSYGDELSTDPDKFFYFDDLEGVLFLDGKIEKGMYTNFRQAITENKIHTIVLSSLGGNVEEGLNIAGTVFDKGIKTYIPKGYECYSACSFIFFAGSEKYALGKLGVHQAAYADDISKEKIAVGVVKTISQISTADILLRLGEFNTPRFVEQRMLRTAPEDMYVFNKKELNKLGNLNISDKSKTLFKSIDKFIDVLQSHYAEQDCDNDVAKCTSAQLCQRAAENKSWINATKATKYVIAAKGKGLSCGVPIPVCPENIKECNKEYLCTYGTTSIDTGLSWQNNPFAAEAKLRGYSCGIVVKSVTKQKTSTNKNCFNEPSLCTTNDLCGMATDRNNTTDTWSTSTYAKDYIVEAKRRGLSCGIKLESEVANRIASEIYPIRIALSQFDALGDINAEEVELITNKIMADLIANEHISEIPRTNYKRKIIGFNAPIKFSDWSMLNVDALITGSLKIKDEIFTLQFRLFDISAKEPLGEGIQYQSQVGNWDINWRRVATKVSEEIASRLLRKSDLNTLTVTSPNGDKSAKYAFDFALDLLKEGRYELAITYFDEYISNNSSGALLTASHYFKGDALSRMKEWKSAGKSYLETFKLEPDGKYAAEALTKVGISLGKMQKKIEACNILSRVEARFPKNQVVAFAIYEMQLLGCK